MQYIQGEKPPGCIFCDDGDRASDRERLLLLRADHAIVMLNRYPYAAGHLMVAPSVHQGELSELAVDIRSELMQLIADSSRILKTVYRYEGLNIGANLGASAGAGFAEHLHFHLVPRWLGDVNFMTSIAETRVIPEHLDRIYDELQPRFEELSRR